MADEYLTTKELAKRTGLTCRFWHNRRFTGDSPPYIQVSSRAVRYRWSEVEKWLKDKEVKAST